MYTAVGSEKRHAVWRQAADGGSRPEKPFDAVGFTSYTVIAPDGRSVRYVGYMHDHWRLFRVALDSPSVTKRFVEEEATFAATCGHRYGTRWSWRWNFRNSWIAFSASASFV